MNILLIIGITLFLGTLGGKIFQQMKIPQVVGYIVIGLLLGKSGLRLCDDQMIELMNPLVQLTLGIIGFMVGRELRLDIFKKHGRSIYAVLFGESLITFTVVAVTLSVITGKVYLGILFGALASATAPAATVDVLWEYKTRGPLTTTLLAIVALDDILALVIYGFASVFAKSLITKESLSPLELFEGPLIEIGSAMCVGLVAGYALYWLIQWIKDRERILPFSLSVIAAAVGISVYLKVDLILSSMVTGAVLANLAPNENEEISNEIKKCTTPLYVLFFVLVGARLDFRLFFASGLALIVIAYVLSRSSGKVLGAYLGGFAGGAHKTVQRYLGFCLFSQAGVAVGLAIAIQHNLDHLGPEATAAGALILNTIVASTFIAQIIGPPSVKYAVHKADEVWRDVTEEDIIKSYKIDDIMEKELPLIRENATLYSIMNSIQESDSYHFCVIDQENRLLGVISLGDLRSVFLEKELELNELILAKDIVSPTRGVAYAGESLASAMQIFKRKEFDFLPILDNKDSGRLVGLLRYRSVLLKINEDLILRRGKL